MTTHIAVHVDQAATAGCHVFADRPPILAVKGADLSVDVAGGFVDPDGQLAFARDLLAAVQAFAASTERYFGPYAVTGSGEVAV